ncbi:acyl-CoA dehydratase activase-related protein [Intestinimonas sp. HCP28S3_D6]|uniref:acyl-CoA dehydratase activase-related protein n=1 Tax=Intestinimonas sp. HCP28S3_D6 TaxID=3438942 RepID=UPI003F8B2500
MAKSDLALSAFHAIAKQTIGGLAQGLEITRPVVFEGGPLTFNPALVRVFAQRLGLSKEEVLIPPHPELMVACGAAVCVDTMFRDRAAAAEPARLLEQLRSGEFRAPEDQPREARPFFATAEERQAFEERNRKRPLVWKEPQAGEEVWAYLGIDSGSTTTKFVLMDDNEELLGSFYAPNAGEPLKVAKRALIEIRDRYRKAGATLHILAAGTTGYGEMLFAKAFQAEYHTVETVAHARAAKKYVTDATFILDIGGQDMKAMWLDKGIITNILVNEACSSGCGSFLENFASSLGIPTKGIEEAAFASRHPAVLGSRCTVFMNSSIITEQRNGRSAEDIMAGLCRSIIENVFTKVIRLSNLDSLGDKIVVQGGTFENDAVLRAMEEYTGRNVLRAPYPGLMGAIGMALITRERYKKNPANRTFLDLEELDGFSYRQEENAPCPFCANHCKRTILRFSNGSAWITNNRCERGEILGDPKDESVRKQLKETTARATAVPNLFREREKLLFQDYPCPEPTQDRGVTIGIPRVLSFWEAMPFWSTFLRALGFTVRLSDPSTRKIYEGGISAVTSDTVCFPAKLVHGHLRNLAEKGVDRIFMPVVTTVPSENTEKTSQSMCAVVKGYPLVIGNSDDPEKLWGIPYDDPMFHWYTMEDQEKQLKKYMKEKFQIPEAETLRALQAGNRAQDAFRDQLKALGQQVLDQVEREDKFAVVLAARPYHNDALVNHELPEMFTGMGIPVLTADSLPGTEEEDLSLSRLDIVNNFHARMISSAILAAKSPRLEYVQLVSFGCGHDAYLSDEIIRLMKEISGKVPLVLKVDESDVQGPLHIRVRSFLETVSMRRELEEVRVPQPLSDPYPVKFEKAELDRGNASPWYAPAQAVGTAHGLFAGTKAGMEEPVSRYDMAAVMTNILRDKGSALPTEGEKAETQGEIGDFATIPAGYKDAVTTVFSLDLITGTDEQGTFAGDRSVDRAQAAVLYGRLKGVLSGGGQTPAGPEQPVESEQPETPELPAAPSNVVGTISSTPVTLSLDTHKPVVDYWSEQSDEIKGLTDKDAFNAAVDTLVHSDLITSQGTFKGTVNQNYNYAVIAKDSFNSGVAKVNSAMPSLYAYDAKFGIRIEKSLIYYTACPTSEELSQIFAPIFAQFTDGMSDREKVEICVKAVCDRFNYEVNGGFSWTNGKTTGDCEDYAIAINQIVGAAGIPCYLITGDVRNGAHAWNHAFVDGEWVILDGVSTDVGKQTIFSFSAHEANWDYPHSMNVGGEIDVTQALVETAERYR